MSLDGGAIIGSMPTERRALVARKSARDGTFLPCARCGCAISPKTPGRVLEIDRDERGRWTGQRAYHPAGGCPAPAPRDDVELSLEQFAWRVQTGAWRTGKQPPAKRRNGSR